MTEPQTDSLVVACADAYVLRGTVFMPRAGRDRGATVIVCPAMLVRERYYRRFALDLANRGFRAITFDQRGIGRSISSPAPAPHPRLRHWAERDLPAVLDYAEQTTPGHRLYAVGHSMGGQIPPLTEAIHRLDGIVTVGATEAWWGHWPFPYNLAILASYVALPILGRVLPVIPADRFGLGPDADGAVVRDWTRWGRHRGYLRGPFGHDLHDQDYAGRVLAYSFTDDLFGAWNAVEAIHAGYVRADLEHRHVDPPDFGARGIGHFGYFRGPASQALWDDTVQWLET